MTDENSQSARGTDDQALQLAESRRSLLKKVGVGTGVGFLTSPHLVSGKPDDYVEIVTTKQINENGEEEVVRTKEVPRSWYNQITTARQVSEQIKEEFLSLDGIHSIGITGLDEAVDGFNKHAVLVRLLNDDIEKSIPDERDGIPIIVKRNVPKFETQGHGKCSVSCYNSDYDPVKGGVIVEPGPDRLTGSESDDCLGVGTTTCRVDSTYMLTAAHLFMQDAAACSSVVSQDAYQHEDYFGNVKEIHDKHDAALIELNSSSKRSSISDNIVTESYPVDAYESKNGVASLVGNSTIRHGVGSCTETPTVDNYDVDSGYNCLVDVVEYDPLNNCSQAHDSGAPYFVRYSNLGILSMIGLHTGIDDTDCNFAQTMYGPACYGMANSYGWSFT